MLFFGGQLYPRLNQLDGASFVLGGEFFQWTGYGTADPNDIRMSLRIGASANLTGYLSQEINFEGSISAAALMEGSMKGNFTLACDEVKAKSAVSGSFGLTYAEAVSISVKSDVDGSIQTVSDISGSISCAASLSGYFSKLDLPLTNHKVKNITRLRTITLME